MTGIRHWQQDGAPSDYARLLRAARNEQPSEERMQRALVSAGIVGATTLVANSALGVNATTASSVGSALGKGLVGVATKLVAVSVLGASTYLTTTAVVRHHRTTEVQAVPAHHSAKKSVAGIRQIQSVGPVPERSGLDTEPSIGAVPITEPEIEPEQLIPKRGSSHVLNPDNVASRLIEPAVNSDQPKLFQEISLIDAARTSLQTGAAGDAMRSAQEYQRKFAAGRFAPEAQFLMMQASRQLGQWDRATAAAREILERFPNSPHAWHARELLLSTEKK